MSEQNLEASENFPASERNFCLHEKIEAFENVSKNSVELLKINSSWKFFGEFGECAELQELETFQRG